MSDECAIAAAVRQCARRRGSRWYLIVMFVALVVMVTICIDVLHRYDGFDTMLIVVFGSIGSLLVVTSAVSWCYLKRRRHRSQSYARVPSSADDGNDDDAMSDGQSHAADDLIIKK